MIEKQIQQGIFNRDTERSFADKVLARQDVDHIRSLMRKPRLDRSDLLELMYMCLSVESKLLNYGEWDRYVILKFFAWVREYFRVAEVLYDYKDFLENKEKEGEIILSPRTEQLLDNNALLIEHTAKYLVDVYLNIGRTSLSLSATGFLDILTNKYEVSYPYATQVGTPQIGEPSRGGLFGIGGKKGG
jgi:hypothetical protein